TVSSTNSREECVTRRSVLAVPLAMGVPLDCLTPDAAPCGAGTGPPRGETRAGFSEREGSMTLQLRGALRRSLLMVAALAAAAVLALGFASPAGAYGGGAGHDTWQVGISFNCNNPSPDFCGP